MSKFSKLNQTKNSIDPERDSETVATAYSIKQTNQQQTGWGNILPGPFIPNQFSTKLHPAKGSSFQDFT